MQTSSRQTFHSSFHNYGNGKWFHLKGNYWGNPCFTGPSWKKMNHPPTINVQGISHFSGRVTHYTHEGICRHSLLQMWSWWWLASCMGGIPEIYRPKSLGLGGMPARKICAGQTWVWICLKFSGWRFKNSVEKPPPRLLRLIKGKWLKLTIDSEFVDSLQYKINLTVAGGNKQSQTIGGVGINPVLQLQRMLASPPQPTNCVPSAMCASSSNINITPPQHTTSPKSATSNFLLGSLIATVAKTLRNGFQHP